MASPTLICPVLCAGPVCVCVRACVRACVRVCRCVPGSLLLRLLVLSLHCPHWARGWRESGREKRGITCNRRFIFVREWRTCTCFCPCSSARERGVCSRELAVAFCVQCCGRCCALGVNTRERVTVIRTRGRCGWWYSWGRRRRRWCGWWRRWGRGSHHFWCRLYRTALDRRDRFCLRSSRWR